MLLPFIFLAGVFHTKNAVKREKLQDTVDRAMQGRAGAAVVAGVQSGEIRAAYGMEVAATRLARPGSTLKPLLLVALLDSGKLDASQRLVCQRVLRIGGVKMDCTHPASVKELDAEEAIAYSCNSYFAQVAMLLSAAELVQAFRRAGLDSPSGLVKEEASGRIETPRSRDMLQLEALGDRGIEVTPLELLEAYRKLALERRNVAAPTHTAVFAGLESSITYGMGHAASVEGMKIAGKTGTAASRESPGQHGFFVGFAPAEKPVIVLVIYLEQGRGADAAGVAREIFAEFAKGSQTP